MNTYDVAHAYSYFKGLGMPDCPLLVAVAFSACVVPGPDPAKRVVDVTVREPGEPLTRVEVHPDVAMAVLTQHVEKWWLASQREFEVLEISTTLDPNGRFLYQCSVSHVDDRHRGSVLGQSRNSKIAAIMEACKRRPVR